MREQSSRMSAPVAVNGAAPAVDTAAPAVDGAVSAAEAAAPAVAAARVAPLSTVRSATSISKACELNARATHALYAPAAMSVTVYTGSVAGAQA